MYIKINSDTMSFNDVLHAKMFNIRSIREKGDIDKRGKINDKYGITIEFSGADFDEFEKQVNDAIEFINNNHKDIFEIIRNHESKSAYIDFALYSRLGGDKNIVNQNDTIPLELIHLCSKAGLSIEMGYYSNEV